MKIRLEKRYTKEFQVAVVEVECEHTDVKNANILLDNVGVNAINSMVESLGLNREKMVAPTINVDKLPTAGAKPYSNSVKTAGNVADAPSVKQLEWLKKKNIAFDPETITKAEATKLLDEVFLHDKKAPKVAVKQETYSNDLDDLDLPF